MSRLIKKRSKKAGLPPGSLVHIGDKRTDKVRITVMDYDEMHLQEKELSAIEECFVFKGKPTVTWINVEGVHQPDIMQKLGDCYGFHPLVLEDILNTDQRPKIEDYADYLYIVLKMLHPANHGNAMAIEQVSIILGPNFVISFQEGVEGDAFDPIRERIRSDKGRIRKSAADYLAYSLLDAIVDNYFVVLERIGERIELLEEELVVNPTPKTLHAIHGLKREMIFLRRSIWPLRDVLAGLERGDSTMIRESSRIYLRDVYDHVVQVIDTIETFRDMVTGMLDIYLSSISNRMNQIMKVLTIIATIFIPLTFIAGVYGMNFKYMPELEWRWGYPALLLIMSAIGVSMLFYFRNKKWF